MDSSMTGGSVHTGGAFDDDVQHQASLGRSARPP
jgi:hypothetical protein